jgi:MFS family permease
MVPFGFMSRLWSAVLCGYLALGATIQALPGLGLGSAATTGALVTLAAAATAIARPFAGRWADRGARVGAALVALGALGHLVARSVPEMASARLVLGAGEGALFTGALVAVLHDAPPLRRGRLIGHFGLSMWGGLALGPVLASAAGDAALWLAAACALGSLALATIAAPGRIRRVTPRVSAPLLPPVALRLGLLLGLSSFGYGTLNAFVSTRTGHAGLALGLFAGAFVVARALGSRLVDDFGPRRVARAAIAVEALALPFIPHPAALIVLGAGLSLVLPALMAWLVELDGRGAAVGAITSCWDVGIAVAGPVGGLSVGHAFTVAALAAGAGALAPVAGAAQRGTLRV